MRSASQKEHDQRTKYTQVDLLFVFLHNCSPMGKGEKRMTAIEVGIVTAAARSYPHYLHLIFRIKLDAY